LIVGRQIPEKSVKGKIEEITFGQLHILHAVAPTKSAITRNTADGLSEFTGEFLSVMKKANDTYPHCLKSWLKFHSVAEAVDKMAFEFPILVDVENTSATYVPPTKPFKKWNPPEIADWLLTLDLSEDKTSAVLQNKIDGSGLILICDDSLWDEFGFRVKMDIAKIKSGIKKLLV